MKITNGFIKKVEKRLRKQWRKDYGADGFWCEISNISIDLSDVDGNNLYSFTIRYGREETENDFTNEKEIVIADGSIDFIVGQIVGYNLCDEIADGNK